MIPLFLAFLLHAGMVSAGLPPVPALPPSARTAYGLLWLDIDAEGAEIALDGLYLDKDVWLVSVPPGRHELLVRKPGFRPYGARFGIAPGQNLRLDVRLEAAPDSLARPPI